MVPPVLAPRDAVQVEVDAKAVLSRPLDPAEKIPPGRAEEVRVVVVGLDSPVGEGYADVVETCIGNFGKGR